MLKRFLTKIRQVYLMILLIPIGLAIFIQLSDPERGGLTVFQTFMLAPIFHGFALVVAVIVSGASFVSGGGSGGNHSGSSGFGDFGGDGGDGGD